MNLAVTLAGATDNPEGLPPEWPAAMRRLADGEAPGPAEIVMTPAEYEAHLAQHAAAKEAWNAGLRPGKFVWDPKEFLDRFTLAELGGIATAARTDAVLDVMFRKLGAANQVNSDHPELLAGMAYLVQSGLLTEERRAQILGTA